MESNTVFDNAILLSHSACSKGYGLKLNEVSIRDYKSGGFNDKIVCIDLDTYERAAKSGSPNNTMDAAIGICNYQNNRRVSKRLLLVELRLDYKSSKNLSGTELRRKSSHSRELLGMEISIDPNDYFIFDDTIIEESRRKINNLAIENGYKDKWHSQTVEEFNSFVQDAELLPYCPVNSPDQICSEIESCGKDINCLIKINDKWLQEARNYKDRYNFNETESICNAVITSLKIILDEHHFDNEEVEWYIEEMISDYEGVLKSVKRLI